MLLPYLLKVSLLLAALTLSYRWLIQFETFSHLNRALLWLNVLAAWSLPLIPLAEWGPVEVQQEFHRTLPEIVDAVPTIVVPIAKKSIEITSQGTPGTLGWKLADWFLLVYCLGVGVMLARFLYQAGGLWRALWRHPAKRLANGVLLVRDEGTLSPYSFFHWVVYNPENHTSSELQQILLHESEHARRGHSFDLLLAEIQRLLLWFNPFAWVHQRLVQGNLEYLADRAVLASGFERKGYQISLLKTALRTNEPPLTNSFAQSLLKKRIKMMNRKPSPYWVAGKYACLLATLYLSSAFVAPYKNQLVEMSSTPLQPVVSALVPESVATPEKTAEAVPAPEPEKEQVVQEIGVEAALTDSVKDTKSRWIVMKDDTLYWSLASTATWEDINLMKEIIGRSGVSMEVNQLKYDPTQSFITAFNLHMQTIGGGSGTAWDKEDDYSPIEGYSGYIVKGGRGMGQTPPEPLLSRLKQSHREALALKRANKNKYLEDGLMKELIEKAGSMGGRGYTKQSFEDVSAEKSLKRDGIGKSPDNTLMFGNMNKEADFYLNAEPSTFEELNGISLDNIDRVEVRDASKTKKRYILVYTN